MSPPTTAATSNHHVTTPIEKCTVRESFHSGSNVSSKLLPEQLQSCSCRFQHRQLRTGRCLHTHVHKWSTDGSLTFAQPRGDSPPFYGYITLSEERLAYYPPRRHPLKRRPLIPPHLLAPSRRNGQTSSTVTGGFVLTSSIYLRSCAEYGCFPIFRLTSAHVTGRARRPKIVCRNLSYFPGDQSYLATNFGGIQLHALRRYSGPGRIARATHHRANALANVEPPMPSLPRQPQPS